MLYSCACISVVCFFNCASEHKFNGITVASKFHKRENMYTWLVQRYAMLLEKYPNLWILLPRPEDEIPKRSWEVNLFHARRFMREIWTCEETGDRTGCHNHILETYKDFLKANDIYRQLLPDPSSEIVDSEWLESEVEVVVLFHLVCLTISLGKHLRQTRHLRM